MFLWVVLGLAVMNKVIEKLQAEILGQNVCFW